MEFSQSLQMKKAYLISLCLCAQKVLAENSAEGEVVEQKAMLQQILDAVTNPSGEHYKIYMGFGLTIIVAIIYWAMNTMAQGDA